MAVLAPTGDFRTSYRADTTIFPTFGSRAALWAGLAVLCCAKSAKTVTLLSIILTAVDVLVHFLDAGIARHQA